jgi:AGZA family xanthine/uracil permease-like MFS transporter
MLDRYFGLSRQGTNVRREAMAGLTTFLTMAYILFVQPAVLTGRLSGQQEDLMDFGAVTTATCLSAALATAIMALYARYPIAQAPGMGENFFFILSIVPAAAAMIDEGVRGGTIQPGETEPWRIALGVVFYSGVLFLLFTLAGLRQVLLDTITPSMRHAIAAGIGLFIAYIGLRNAGVVLVDNQGARLNYQFASPDRIVFFFGLVLSAGLLALRVPAAIFWGIASATLLAIAMRPGLPYAPPWIAQAEVVKTSHLIADFRVADRAIALPPSVAPTLFAMDLRHALAPKMAPFILICLFMVVFDTLGTLVGVAERAGLMRDNKLPRAREAFLSDAAGTVVGAALGTSTVTSFIESVAGVEQGGRTGLTALVTAALFLLALFFSPVVAMVGSYGAITAPALVIVGSLMMQSVAKIEWTNHAEALPAFLILLGIPLSYSIADGLALGFIAYPVVKLLAGQGRDVKWLMYVMAAVLAAYFVAIRAGTGP